MYGVVLMVAMTGGAETPALFKSKGCCGTATYSCCGYSSCCGTRTHKWHKSKGCCGTPVYSCCGAPVYSCCGAPAVSCYGAPVTYGTPVPHAAPIMEAPPVIVPEIKKMPEIKGKEVEKLKKPPVSNETVEAAPARITITVPGDARVSVDGTATVSSETTRTFESPVLTAGKSYSYTFTAEFVRDGKNVVVTRNVEVKAGSDITVSLENETVVASR
jgi:uncharacterized protein (TIGR03000 family)